MSAGPTSQRVVGPYGEHYRDPATGEPRTRLTAEGRAKCAELVAEYPHPVALLKSHHAALYGVLLACRFDAEDIDALCRTAVVKAVVRWDPTRAKLSTCVWWSLRSEVGLRLGQFRRHEAREVPGAHFDAGTEFALLVARPEPDPDAPATVARLLARLPPRQREVLVGTYFDGLTGAELGRRIGRTKELVRQTREAALTRLRGLVGVESARERRERGRVAAALTDGPASAEALARKLKLDPGRVRQHLAHMTRAGRVVRVPGRGRSFVYALPLEGKKV